MTETANFPLNAWYAAGWRRDIGESLTARTICEIPMVLFRRRDGGVSVLEDACKHRLLPLSMGRLVNDEVICGYHGMTFAASGECVKVPGVTRTAPSRANCVRTFPVVERHNLVWIWPGDAEKADPASIPDLHWADDTGWTYGPCYLPMACDFRLVLDNLMDLTHETFVHPTSIGQMEIVEAPSEVTTEGRHVWLKRFMTDIDAPPFLALQMKLALGLPPEHVDRWQIIRFEAPSTIVIDVGVAPTGTGAAAGDYSKGVNTQVLNTVTPGKAGEAHYYFTLARNFLIDDADLTERLRSRNVEVFLEDKAILEAQQQTIERLPGRPLLNFGIDKGGMRARQAIARMVADESAGKTARQEQRA
jgi:phenylpropionate dioxygenase-like ring-hydroxylating dioxygenase large terminal subunit